MTDHSWRTTMRKATTAAARRGRGGGGGGRGGFTLTELLVVIGVIVLMIAMAVPLFNVFSASHSIEGAQNMVSAMLQRARARALAMQERRGVFFFEDQSTRKMAMLLVKINDPASPPPGATMLTSTYVLELDQNDEELQLLPQGVGAVTILGANPAGGANTKNTTYRPYGLIVFDGLGRIVTLGNYTSEADDANRYPADSATGKPSGVTFLKFRYKDYIYSPAAQSKSQWVGTAANQEFSQCGLLLYDKETFQEQFPPDSLGDWRTMTAQQTTWLDQNGTACVVNRYNGTLIKGQGE